MKPEAAEVGRSPVWIVLAFIVSILAVLVGSESLQPSFKSWAWLLPAAALEWRATRLPVVGRFCGADALYLAGAASVEFGPVGALLVLLSCSFWELRGKTELEFCQRAIPVLISSTLLSSWSLMLELPAGLLAYSFAAILYLGLGEMFSRMVLVEQLGPEQRVAWLRVWRTVLDFRFSLAFAGGILMFLTPGFPWLPLAFLPLLWATHRGVSNGVFRVQANLAQETKTKAVQLSANLARTQRENQILHLEIDQLTVLLKLTRELGSELHQEGIAAIAERLGYQDFGAVSGGVIWDELSHFWGDATAQTWNSLEQSRHFCCRLPKEGQDFGRFFLVWPQLVQLTEEHERLLTTFAYSLGLALENSGRYRQMRQVQQELVSSSRLSALGELASGVAHELNSPLAAISLSLDALSTQICNEKGQSRVKRAQDACRRAVTIVDKLLVYSREKPAPPQSFKASNLLHDVATFLGANLRAENIELTILVETQASISGSWAELQQVLINLILNAMASYEKSDREPRAVELSCLEAGDTVEITVRDYGCGVSAEDSKRIFEPFFTTKPTGKGTGLGLSISRDIAGAHEGSLELESPSSGGARFVLTIPRAND